MPSPTPQTNLEKELETKLAEIKKRSEEDQARKLAKKLKLPYSNFKLVPINTDALNLVQEGAARAGQIAVVSKTGLKLQVAVRDPDNKETKTILEDLTSRKFKINLVITTAEGLETVWKRYESIQKIEKVELGIVAIDEIKILDLQEKIKNISDLKDNISKLKLSEIVNTLIAGALKIEASDIHLEPEEESLRVRYRIDGVLSDVAELPNKEYSKLLSRIKLVSGLKINIFDTPQDGRFTIRVREKDIEVRVSVLPGAYGENVVMRVLDPDKISQELGDLGIRSDLLEKIKRELKRTTGAILTTGPTGSGKTTTLYAFVRFVNIKETKIITIEDPVEYHIKGISQTQIDERKGYNFASGLRSIVRQDPDVILVGEIRDKETAEIAMQSSLTGHLVFSTLHTNDSFGAIPRLIDLGVKNSSIAPALNMVMAQRLVRKLCEKCKELKKITPQDFDLMKNSLSNIPKNIKIPKLSENTKIYYPKECEECNNTGYKGRIGVFEILFVDEEMEKIILKNPSILEIRNVSLKKGVVTILQDGYLKVMEGITSTEEVERVLTL